MHFSGQENFLKFPTKTLDFNADFLEVGSALQQGS